MQRQSEGKEPIVPLGEMLKEHRGLYRQTPRRQVGREAAIQGPTPPRVAVLAILTQGFGGTGVRRWPSKTAMATFEPPLGVAWGLVGAIVKSWRIGVFAEAIS
jgi:hypothetical protein